MLNKFFDKVQNEKKYLILFLLILTTIGVLPILMSGIPYGGDLNFHLKRIEAIALNIKENKIGYPIYFNYLNNYGYGSGLFYPDIFLYIPAIFNILGISLFTSYKIFIYIIKLVSLVSMYCTIKAITDNKTKAIIGVILYAFSSYIFVDMFERAALAETLTIIFIPIVIRGIHEILFGDKNKYYILSIGMIGLLYSHLISFYLVTIFLIIFTILNYKQLSKEKVISIIKSIIIFILVCSHFLLPLIEQMISGPFYYSVQKNTLIENSVPILFLFLEFPYYSLMTNIGRWIPSGIGIIYLYLCVYYIKNKSKFNKENKMYLIGGFICILFSTKLLWYIPFFNKIFSIIQFPFRIYILATTLFIICFCDVIKISIKKIFIISLLFFSINLFYPFINTKISSLSNDEIMYGEYLPLEYPKLNYSSERLDKIESSCPIKYKIKYGQRIEIKFNSNCEENTIELPIIYYKGYSVKINDLNIDYSISNNGLIKIKTNEKNGIIKVYYEGTKIYNITKYITLISTIGLVIIYVKKK